MTMVRIVRTDGRPLHYMRNPRPCKEVCKLIRGGHFPRNGFYQAEFVEPVPLFDVVTYKPARGPEKGFVLVEDGHRVPLSKALARASKERAADEDAGIGHRWRTVVRAAR